MLNGPPRSWYICFAKIYGEYLIVEARFRSIDIVKITHGKLGHKTEGMIQKGLIKRNCCAIPDILCKYRLEHIGYQIISKWNNVGINEYLQNNWWPVDRYLGLPVVKRMFRRCMDMAAGGQTPSWHCFEGIAIKHSGFGNSLGAMLAVVWKDMGLWARMQINS